MEQENQTEQIMEEIAEPVAEPVSEVPAAPKKNNALIIVIAAVLGVVLLGFLGWAVLMGTDGMDGVKSKMPGIFGGKTEESPTEPAATEPVQQPADAPLNLKSYTVDKDKAAEIADKVVATTGSETLTNGELQVYYQTGILNFYSQYGMYLMYLGVDFSQPLDQQVYDNTTNQTWQEFMLESALQSWQLFSSMRQYGAESDEYGYEFTQAGQEYVDNLSARIQEMAEASGYTDPEEFVKAQIGATATVEGLRSYMESEYYYVCYYSYLQDKLQPTMEQLEQYFATNEETLTSSGITKESEDVVDVRHILIMPKGGTTDENGVTTYSEEEWEAARVEAQALLDQWKSGDATEESFASLANEHTEDPGSQTTGGLYQGVKKGQMVPEFNDWIFDEGRVFADTDLVKTDYGYHVMYFVKREAEWIYSCRKSYLNEAINALIAEVLAQYPYQADYESIGLSN